LHLGWVWVALQFVLTPILILAGLAWTACPTTHLAVALSLFVPLILIICALELQAGTVRKFANDDGKRVKLVWGAVTLLVWIAVAPPCGAPRLVRRPDSASRRLPQLEELSPRAGHDVYLRAHSALAHAFEWVISLVIVPAKLIPYAAAQHNGAGISLAQSSQIPLQRHWWSVW